LEAICLKQVIVLSPLIFKKGHDNFLKKGPEVAITTKGSVKLAEMDTGIGVDAILGITPYLSV